MDKARLRFILLPLLSGVALIAACQFDLGYVSNGDLFRLICGREHALLVSGGTVEKFLWSRDGSQLAFLRRRPPGTTPMGQDLWVADADGSEPRELRHSSGQIVDFDWSPDNTQLVYEEVVVDGAGPALHALFLVSSTGVGLGRLVESGMDERRPRWSSDGRGIVFISGPDRRRSKVFVVPREFPRVAIRLTTLHDTVPEMDPVWSPGGSEVALVVTVGVLVDDQLRQRARIIAVEILPDGHVGSRVREIALEEVGAVGRPHSFAAIEELEWSPDARWLLFLGLPEDTASLGRHLFTVLSGGSFLRDLTALTDEEFLERVDDQFPAWSPSGQDVAFVRDGNRRVRPGLIAGVHDLFRISSALPEPRPVPLTDTATVFRPAWRPSFLRFCP